jgi:hypothetical protein
MPVQNNHDKYHALRQQFSTFYYEGFEYEFHAEELSIRFNFRIDDFVEFHPTIKIPGQDFLQHKHLTKDALESMIFHIGMVELISYWKAICPPKVVIRDFNLNEDQKAFWKKIYYHGLGEFFYLNSIETSMDDFMEISSTSKRELPFFKVETEAGTIIPVGGGKDSVVSLELLKNDSGDNLALIMNPRGASTTTANIAGFEERTIVVKRTLDKKLLELNAQGYLNGHTPFSALLGFVTVLAAALARKKYIALSNESSANESTVIGTDVNHQYSKSLEFETDFRDYVHSFLTKDIEYFSLLRPISELQIASLFAKSPQYFYEFKSCNAGSKQNIWCGKCSKCLFTFIILSPFIAPDELVKIYGNNLLDDPELETYFDELTGLADVKPFECVGTVDEVNAALCMALDFYNAENLPFLLQKFVNSLLFKFCDNLNREDLLKRIEQKHFLEEHYQKLLFEALGVN